METDSNIVALHLSQVAGADKRAAMLQDMVHACEMVCARYGRPDAPELASLSDALRGAMDFARLQVAGARAAGVSEEEIDGAAAKLGLSGLTSR